MSKSDIDIAREARKEDISEIALKCGLEKDDYIPYGHYKAKISLSAESLKCPPKGKLVLVTAINPTPAGEGKTTTSVGLADGLSKIGVNACVALREPSLGPVFGMKGGAAGGGYSQVVPMEDLNLHFTGDMHAITSANNLLSALIDNHVYQGNSLQIDTENIIWRRVITSYSIHYTKLYEEDSVYPKLVWDRYAGTDAALSKSAMDVILEATSMGIKFKYTDMDFSPYAEKLVQDLNSYNS